VVDLCCSDGWFTLAIAKIARRVTAVSNDAGMLGLTCIRMNENRMFNCAYWLGGARELADLEPRPVDFVFMANSFHAIPDRERLARIVGETLKPGGCFAIINWHRMPREDTIVREQPSGPRSELRLSPEQTVEAIESGGLRSKTIVDLPPYHYGAIFEKPAGMASAAGRTRPA
jgi:SAM-dependent methyltransferase